MTVPELDLQKLGRNQAGHLGNLLPGPQALKIFIRYNSAAKAVSVSGEKQFLIGHSFPRKICQIK